MSTESSEPKKGLFARLRGGLSKTSSKLTDGINSLLFKRRLDDAALADLEDLLIMSDMGIDVAEKIIAAFRRAKFNQEVTPEEVRTALAAEVATLLDPVMKPLEIDATAKPFVILAVGVNGSGKTTTMGKMAKQYTDAGKKVTLVAGDTFRAAAVDQLKVWGTRANCPVIAGNPGADAAGLAYDAVSQACAQKRDIVLIDTAGRLQNKDNLMDELAKIVRVLKKIDPKLPQAVLLVLDGSTGSNALSQAEVFSKVVGVTGIVMTKLDGSARGGALVAVANKFGIPIHAIGIGEGVDDLRPFDAQSYALGLVGLDD